MLNDYAIVREQVTPCYNMQKKKINFFYRKTLFDLHAPILFPVVNFRLVGTRRVVIFR